MEDFALYEVGAPLAGGVLLWGAQRGGFKRYETDSLAWDGCRTASLLLAWALGLASLDAMQRAAPMSGHAAVVSISLVLLGLILTAPFIPARMRFFSRATAPFRTMPNQMAESLTILLLVLGLFLILGPPAAYLLDEFSEAVARVLSSAGAILILLPLLLGKPMRRVWGEIAKSLLIRVRGFLARKFARRQPAAIEIARLGVAATLVTVFPWDWPAGVRSGVAITGLVVAGVVLLSPPGRRALKMNWRTPHIPYGVQLSLSLVVACGAFFAIPVPQGFENNSAALDMAVAAPFPPEDWFWLATVGGMTAAGALALAASAVAVGLVANRYFWSEVREFFRFYRLLLPVSLARACGLVRGQQEDEYLMDYLTECDVTTAECLRAILAQRQPSVTE